VNFTIRDSGEASYRLRITVPEDVPAGDRVMSGNVEVLLGISAQDQGVIQLKDKRTFSFSATGDPRSGPVRIDVYDYSAGTPALVGQVDVTLGGGVVYSTTTPSFGIQLLEYEPGQKQ
jgi:hypothetical protein